MTIQAVDERLDGRLVEVADVARRLARFLAERVVTARPTVPESARLVAEVADTVARLQGEWAATGRLAELRSRQATAWMWNDVQSRLADACVLVALALLLLTVRYIRVTKPSSSADVEPDLPMLPPDLDLNDDSIFVDDPDVASPAAPAAEPSPHPVADEGTGSEPAAVAAATATLAADAPPAADHDAADEDWEPRTGEHERVEIPRGTTLVRPSVAARRKALGVD